jgi:hypothetical protein
MGLLVLIAVAVAVSFMLMSGSFRSISFAEPPRAGNSAFLFASSLIILTVPIKKLSGACWGYAAGAAAVLLLMLGIFMVLSPNQATLFNNPLFAAIRETRSNKLELLARLDSLFIMLWLFASFCRGAIFRHAIDVFANAALPQKLSRRWSFLAITLIIFTVSIWGQPIVLGTDAKDIQNRNIVSAIAAAESGGIYTLMFEIADVSKEEPATTWLIGRGANSSEARADAESKTDKVLYTDSVRAVILSKGINVQRIAEKLRDDSNYRKNMFVFETEDIQSLEELHFVGRFLQNAEKSPKTFLDILNGEYDLPEIEVEAGAIKVLE